MVAEPLGHSEHRPQVVPLRSTRLAELVGSLGDLVQVPTDGTHLRYRAL